MKFLKVSLLAALMIGGTALAGCSKKSSGSSSNPISNPSTTGSSSSSSSAPETVYTVTESEYLLIRSFFSSPQIFVNGNLTFSNFMSLKIADGKVDFGGTDKKYDIDVSSYNSATNTAAADIYEYNGSGWTCTHEDVLNLTDLQGLSQLYYFTILPGSFNQLTYSEATHKYTAQEVIPDPRVDLELQFENTKLMSCTFVGEMSFTFEMSNYGTTTVEFPAV